MKKKPNPKLFHTVLMRQGHYTLTTFVNLRGAQEFIWALLKRHHNRKFAILRNRDNKIVQVFNDPRWKELQQYERLQTK